MLNQIVGFPNQLQCLLMTQTSVEWLVRSPCLGYDQTIISKGWYEKAIQMTTGGKTDTHISTIGHVEHKDHNCEKTAHSALP